MNTQELIRNHQDLETIVQRAKDCGFIGYEGLTPQGKITENFSFESGAWIWNTALEEKMEWPRTLEEEELREKLWEDRHLINQSAKEGKLFLD